MPKKTKSAKKVGRTEEISTKDLLNRFRALKCFLEDNWGRIGLRLQRVHHPEDVRAIFKLVPSVQWCPPFRDYSAKCLIEEGSTEIGIRELRQTQEKHEEAVANESRCWSEFHPAQQRALEAKTAFDAFLGEYQSAKCLIHFLRHLFAIAKELEVKVLVDRASLVADKLREAQRHQLSLKQQRSMAEAWFARNEVVDFVKTPRYTKNPVNFAKAMAGLPEYSWIYSFRKCPEIEKDPLYPSTLNYQLFELLEATVKKVRPLTMKNVEVTLKAELLKRDPKDLLRVHFGPTWAFIQQAIASCTGQRLDRKGAAYALMAKIQDNLERGKTITEVELAKRRQLV